MPARKRAIVEVDASEEPASVAPELHKLRNMWEFASLMQYIYLFGECVRINPDVDIDMLEMECTKPTPSNLLPQIGLALLKHVSSHRGLTPEIFDEYTRRQYMAKAPQRNPFGEEEQPRRFTDLDVFTKIRVLHQLSTWTMISPTRFREYYATSVPDQTQWRIEPFGWDRHDRTYFILDDNRLYRQTRPQPASTQHSKAKAEPKAKTLPKKAQGSRSSKRRKVITGDSEDEAENDESQAAESATAVPDEDPDNGLGGTRWECLALSHSDFIEFVDGLRKSKDPNEKALVKRMQAEIMPEIERQAAARERKMAQQEREKMNILRLAGAKRSSRLAGKQEKEKEHREAEEAERRKREELAMAHREQDKQKRMEEARESRMMTREQRLKEREVKRILHEEELKKLEQQSEYSDTAEGRTSERQRKTEMERKKEELKQWTEEDGDWYFDCAICGTHGKNLDDGTHSIACERCDIWQHSSCHGIREQDAEKDDFHFLCASCSKPRQIKIRKTSTSPGQSKKISNEASPSQTTSPSAAQRNQTDTTAPKPAVVVPPRQSLPPQQNWSTSHAHPGSQRTTTMLHNAYARSNGINHPAPSTYASSHQQPNGPAQQPNGYRPPAPSYLQSAPKGVTASPMEPSMSPQQQQIHRNQPAASYNPHQNGFARQRPPSSSLSAAMTPSNSQQARPFHEGQARTYAPSYGAPQSFSDTTPYTNGHMPNMASSPTPSLSATQGQTSVRFSPSGHNTSANGPAYVPNNNQPAPAAYSPMKHASPPAAHVRNFSNSNGQPLGNSQTPATVDPAQKSHSPVVGPHAPTLQSSSPKAPAAGISPVKHDLPPSSPPNSISRDVDIPRPDIPDSSGTLSNLPPTKQHPSSSPLPPALGIPSLQSVPALKPNVGTENQQGKALQPPVKRT